MKISSIKLYLIIYKYNDPYGFDRVKKLLNFLNCWIFFFFFSYSPLQDNATSRSWFCTEFLHFNVQWLWIHCCLILFLDFLIEDQSLRCLEGLFKLSEFHGPISTTDWSTTMSLNPPIPVLLLSVQLPFFAQKIPIFIFHDFLFFPWLYMSREVFDRVLFLQI